MKRTDKYDAIQIDEEKCSDIRDNIDQLSNHELETIVGGWFSFGSWNWGFNNNTYPW